jgi:hypothetical protein
LSSIDPWQPLSHLRLHIGVLLGAIDTIST